MPKDTSWQKKLRKILVNRGGMGGLLKKNAGRHKGNQANSR
jgi:hypothetical protein